MDFFNKLGKKTNEAYQTAKEKTSKISEEIKLKSKITKCEEDIFEKYAEIGQIVFDKMQAGVDASKEEIIPKCDAIVKLKEDIEKAKVEILNLKDIKKCVDCGAELAKSSEFCSKCGKQQPKVEDVEIKVEEKSVQSEAAQPAEVTEIKDASENVSGDASNNEVNKDNNVYNNIYNNEETNIDRNAYNNSDTSTENSINNTESNNENNIGNNTNDNINFNYKENL